MHVAVTNGNGTTYEQGQAVQSDGLCWEYTTQTRVSGDPIHVFATVEDMPGNNHQLSWQN